MRAFSGEQRGEGVSPTHGPGMKSHSHPPRGACRQDGIGNRHFRRRRKLRRVRWRIVDGVIDFAGQVCWADQTNGKLSTALERSGEAGVRYVLDPARERDPRCPLSLLLPY